MNIIIYSANIGGYDNFNNLAVEDPKVRYILFTDNKYYTSDVWEICHTDFIDKSLDSRRAARYIKTNPHIILPPHDISIWVDYCLPPNFKDANKMLIEIGALNSDIMCYKHDERDCIYQEAEMVKKLKLEYPNIVSKQIEKYKSENFPEKYGLFQSGFMIRKNNKKIANFNETWWNEIKNNSARDQLSQVYSAWKCGITIDSIKIDKSVYSNRYLKSKIPHPKKWTI